VANVSELLEVAGAQSVVLQHVRPLPPAPLPLNAAALGLILAEDVHSDLDMPPYEKALMDGYAVRAADLPEGRGELTVIEEVTAGRTPAKRVQAGQATRIMTGAPMPDGADAVIMVERCQTLDSTGVRIEDRPPKPGQNVLPRGREMRRGDCVIRAGRRLRPQEFGVLATVGRDRALVHPAPRVAVVSTGDEIVEATQTPGPSQIRNGNGPMILAQVARAGGVPLSLGIARDRRENLLPLIGEGLKADVFLLSGGVSAGKLDLVPEVLRELGVRPHFHRIRMKPGKPLFFGTHEQTMVFGLPGNPVSAFVCFELFVRPALRRLCGAKDAGPPRVRSKLAQDFSARNDRPTYHPAWLDQAEDGSWRVRASAWFGSPDLRGLLQANALLELPSGDLQWREGEWLDVIRVDQVL
jgi:molybdopterin molybdotransferase